MRRVALTPREIQVIRLAALGHSDKQIATKFEISPRTVEAHFRALREKLGPVERRMFPGIGLVLGLITVGDLVRPAIEMLWTQFPWLLPEESSEFATREGAD